MTSKENFRILILGLLLLSGLGVLGKSIFLPQSSQSQTQRSLQLPDTVPLTEAQQLTSQSINSPFSQGVSTLAHQGYRYQISTLPSGMDTLGVYLGVYYVVNSNGNVPKYVKEAFALPSPQGKTAVQQNSLGQYLQIVEPDKIQLSTCLDPYGRSTVAIRDYQWNRNFRDLQYRMVPWLLGKPLKDERCLFTTMTIPLEAGSETLSPESQERLKSLWQEWCEWWAHNFPNPA